MPCSALRQSVGGKTVIREDGIVARFIAEMPTGKPDDMVRFIAEDYLSKEGFKPVSYTHLGRALLQNVSPSEKPAAIAFLISHQYNW